MSVLFFHCVARPNFSAISLYENVSLSVSVGINVILSARGVAFSAPSVLTETMSPALSSDRLFTVSFVPLFAVSVVTTLVLPLSLIAGWYGMNFTNMPELHWKYSYLAVAVVSVLIIAVEIYYFKKKKIL